jgi:cobalt-zinc-cadmium efflux system membrane fusion protein
MKLVVRTASLAVLTSTLACRADSDAQSELAPAIAAEVAVVQVRSFQVTVNGFGTLSASPGSSARVAAPGESFVTRVLVGPGDSVEEGAPLVELDRSVWSEQEADAEAALTAAEVSRARAERLVEQGILPRRDLESATAEVARARAVAADASRTLSRAILRSPIRGSVASVTASLSQPVSANDVLVEIVDRAALQAMVRLSPEDAARINPGALVSLTGGTDSSAEPIARGRVIGVSPAVDTTSGTVTARVRVDPGGSILRSGQRVAARIVVAVHSEAIVIPRDALVPTGDGVSVFIVDSAGVAHATPVTLGAEAVDSVEVLAGLRSGMRIVTGGAYGMVDGVRVQESGGR